MKTRPHQDKKGFWESERCEYCGGHVREKEVELLRKKRKSYILFRHVPAGVCLECGARYYSANTLKIISQKLRQQKKPQNTIRVPFMDLAAA